MSVGRTIQSIRTEQGLTQGEVGERAGLAVSYISRIENDRIQPTVATLGRLAGALGVPVSGLFRLGEEEPPPPEHRCPVSSSGECVGVQLRAGHGRRAASGKVLYGEEEIELLRMADYVALRGSVESRRALRVLLEALLGRETTSRGGPGARRGRGVERE